MLRFLSRVAFICNICFLAAVIIQLVPKPPEGDIISMVIVLGYVVAILINGLVNVWCLILLIRKQIVSLVVPKWLLIANLIFLIAELILFLK